MGARVVPLRSGREAGDTRPRHGRRGWGPVLRSLLLFVGVLGASITYLLSPASRPLRTALEHLLAATSGGFLRRFDPTVSVAGSTVSIQGFIAEIIPACTGVFLIAIFLAAVLAFPCSIGRKAYGVLLGVLGILAFNWVRIVTLLLVGAYAPAAFSFLHLVFWRVLAIFFAWVLWLGWARGIAPAPASASAPPRHAAP